MYRIFKNDSSIILTDERGGTDGEKFRSWSKEALRDFLIETEGNQATELFLHGDDLKSMWRDFRKEFKVIEAGGGMVRNKLGETLFIFRQGKWDLPKGKIDPGESVAEAAIREVKEECGFRSVRIEKALPSTFHIYTENGEKILKITHWFAMRSEDRSLEPQLDEGITELEWFGKDNLDKALSNTYPNIALLLQSS